MLPAPPSPRVRSTPEFRVIDMTLKGHKGQGVADENQDRVFQRRLEVNGAQLLLIGVADGVSRCAHGGDVAAYLIERHLAVDAIVDPAHVRSVPALGRHYLRRLNSGFYREFADQPDMLESASTLSLALLENTTAHCAWVGDSPIFISRRVGNRFETKQLSEPDLCGRLLVDCFGAHAPCRLKYRTVQLAPGDVLAVVTDGAARDAAHFDGLINRYGPTEALLEAVAGESRGKTFFDDASVVLAERLR